MTDRYAVFGNPVRHSLSPRIHAAFAKQTGEKIEYSAIEAPRGGFSELVRLFFRRGGCGANITLPFKEDAFCCASRPRLRALQARAANILWPLANGEMVADNSDGTGLSRDLSVNLGWEIRGRRILLFGAGGAVRGVLPSLLQRQPACLSMVNRTVTTARRLAACLAHPLLHVATYETLDCEEPFDLIINGSSAGLHGQFLPLPSNLLHSDTAAYDIGYGPASHAFLHRCKEQGVRFYCDGLGMLVEQAAESFRLWRGIHPETRELIAALRTEFPV